MSSSNKQKAVRDTRAKASFNHNPTIKIRTTLNDYFDRQKCWAADAVGVLDEVLKLVSQSVVEIEAPGDAPRMLRIAKTYAHFVVKRDSAKGQAELLKALCDAARENVTKPDITDIEDHYHRILDLSADLKGKIILLASQVLNTLEIELDGEGAQ